MDRNKFIWRLTGNFENSINLTAVPLAAYFIVVAGGFETAKIIWFISSAILATLLSVVVATWLRFKKLGKTIDLLYSDTPDFNQIKIDLLNYPIFEGISAALRWLSGIGIITLVMLIGPGLSLLEFIPCVLALIICIPISSVLAYLLTENQLNPLHKHEGLIKTDINSKSFIQIDTDKRSLVVIISVVIIPIVIIGYFIFLTNSQHAVFHNIWLHFLLITAFSLIAIYTLIFQYGKSVKNTSSQLIKSLKMLGEGDLSIDEIPIFTSSELGNISKHINQMTNKLRGIIKEGHDVSETTIANCKLLMDKTKRISQFTNEQSDNITEISKFMEVLVENIEGNKEIAQKADSNSSITGEEINDINQHIEDILRAMHNVAEKTKNINAFARQTSLLAINASIQASRSGDHGKGFAVVAAEIRKLSEGSRKAAKEIGEVSYSSLETAASTTELLSNVTPEILDTMQAISEIAAGSKEQLLGAEQINSSILDLNKNATVIVDTFRSMEKKAEKFEELVNKLESTLKTYSLNGKRTNKQIDKELAEKIFTYINLLSQKAENGR